MLIKALCDYADKQAASDIQEGFSEQEINYRIILSPEGELERIVPVSSDEGKKLPSKKIILPDRTQKTSIDPNYIEHRPLYIFGLNLEDDGFTVNDKTDKAKKSHKAFREHELEFMEGLDSEVCTAYRKFIENWIPEKQTENPVLKELGKNYSKAKYGFSLGVGKAELEKDSKLIEKYSKLFAEENKAADNNETCVCGILGEKLPIARLHDKIKFPGGQTSGCQLVCMNNDAFESYGKTQSYNSNVSEDAMKKYTAVFNKLLTEKDHHAFIGDMVLIYFAVKQNDEDICGLFSKFFVNSGDSKEDKELSAIINYARGGNANEEKLKALEKNENVTFYIAGLTPNSSRICQKFIYRDKFGNIIKNLVKHQTDLSINKYKDTAVYFSRIAKELISPKASKDNKVPSPLMTSIIMSALNNTKYPDGLLAAVIRRVKTDRDEDNKHFIKLNDVRAGVIKACLNRKYGREVITMSWNEEDNSAAYICGGLFAVYEKIQQDTSGGTLNRTIKDSYFASCCSRPVSVMPKLAKLAVNHMRKLRDTGGDVHYSKKISELMDKLNGKFPSTLSLDDQGKFIVGYYQMNKKLYSKKEAGKENDHE